MGGGGEKGGGEGGGVEESTGGGGVWRERGNVKGAKLRKRLRGEDGKGK